MKSASHNSRKSLNLALILVIGSLLQGFIFSQEIPEPRFDISQIVTLLQQDPVDDTAVQNAIAELLDDEEITAEDVTELLEMLLALVPSDELPGITQAYILQAFSGAVTTADLDEDLVNQAYASAAAAGRPFAGFLSNQAIVDVPESAF